MILFISDLHLNSTRPAVNRAFFRFLERDAPQAEAVYILGDLFEAWIGDDDPTPLPRQVITALRQLSDGGVPVFIQHGNRDFLLGKRFCRETGATLLAEETVIDLYGRRALLMHGDTLCTHDVDYLRFRRRVRNPVSKFLLRNLPLRKRLALAQRWREGSREGKAVKSEYIMDVNQDEVIRVMDQHDVDLLIHGHTHRPAVHHINCARGEGERIVLGDWHEQAWMLRYHAGGYRLETFPIGA